MDKFEKAYTRLQGKARSILEITVRREKDKVFILREGKQIWFNKKVLANEQYCLAKSAKYTGYIDKVHVAADGEVLDGVHRLFSDPSWPLKWHPNTTTEEQKVDFKYSAQFKRRTNKTELVELINRDAALLEATGKYEPGEYAEAIADKRGFSSQYIRNPVYSHKFCIFREKLIEFSHIQSAAVADIQKFEHRSTFAAELLPREKIRMVFHNSSNYLITRSNVFSPPAKSSKIYRLGSVSDKDYLLLTFGVNKFSNFFARLLIKFGCFFGQSVDASMNVSVVFFVIVGDSFDNLLRFLRGSGVVKID